MKVLLFTLFSIPFFSNAIITGNWSIENKAVEEANKKCGSNFAMSDIAEREEVDSDHDYTSYMITFEDGTEVLVTESFDGNKETSFWAEEVYCP